MAIEILPQNVVDMIAAGEVVERPASVVKELLENAMDAGAARVDVVVENGGKDRIAVTDDGGGMAPDELALAVQSHATSKLATADDLFRVTTFGFRGEALPSIGSVSRMELRSRPRDAEAGARIVVECGQVQGPEPAGCAPGTTVDVRNLFVNTPVRRRFLKANATEMAHITQQVMNAALARPDVGFTLAHGARTQLELAPAADLARRVESFFGRSLAGELIPVSYSEVGLTVTGYVAPPPHSRANRNGVFTYVNGRYVRDRVLLSAVSQAFREFLPVGRHPVVFLFLQLDPAEVDVNVHPTKIEVRFRRSGQMHSLLSTLFREALAGLGHAVDLPLAPSRTGPAPAREEETRRAMEDFFGRKTAGGEAPLFKGRPERDAGPPSQMTSSSASAPRSADSLEADLPSLQVHDAYIIRETRGGVEIIDQHALHERVLYDEILERLAGEGLSTQRLLVPITVSVDPEAAQVLASNEAVLDRLGLEVEAFGPGTVAVQGVPTLLPDREVEGFLQDVVEALAGRGETEADRDLLVRTAQRLACRSAVKAGEPLSPPRIAQLLRRAAGLPDLATCPHGRPAVLRITLQELTRHFRRT